MELLHRKVCIARARARGSAECADDAEEMLLAERLVGEARQRRATRMETRERLVTTLSALTFLLTAVAIAVLVPDERHVDPLLTVALVAGFALILQIRFEFGGYFGSPEQLAIVPLMLLGPLPLVPLLVAVAGILTFLPDFVRGTWHRERWINSFADSWPCVGPVIVLALLAPGPLEHGHIAVYCLAAFAQFGADLTWGLVRNHLLDRLPIREGLRGFAGTARVDAVFIPVAFVISLVAVEEPLYLLVLAPLVWLLHLFSIDRRERYTKALELQRAYRGTVMLLSDVIESEDRYTAEHSRSVVEMVNAVADQLGVPDEDRQELEFAAMLHDVGKIAIPKEILNKPAALTESEFEVIKTHTIEGQFMLDRVGGLLGRVGEIVRSCHERWDGTGYPDGLVAKEIPYASRIVFCCDAFNAMTTDRVYREAMSVDEALAELTGHSGTQFDPAVVAAVHTVVRSRAASVSAADEVRAVLASAPRPREIRAAHTAG
jgi:HD-GYP domain-containing protein (c-di-GMP phosphodiesterase class II)